jgi:hypothetical protein
VKEQLIKLQKNREFTVEIRDGRIAGIIEDPENDGFFADDDSWMFDLYRLLRKADELKAFEHLKFEGWDEKTGTPTSIIYIP